MLARGAHAHPGREGQEGAGQGEAGPAGRGGGPSEEGTWELSPE